MTVINLANDSNEEAICIEEITKLYNESEINAKNILENSIRIGELLVAQKDKLLHGMFTNWIKDNLPFSVRKAQMCMKNFRNKDRLKNEKISLFTDAVNLVSVKRDMFKKSKTDEELVFFTIKIHEEYKEIIEATIEIAKIFFETESNSEAIRRIFEEWAFSVPIEKQAAG